MMRSTLPLKMQSPTVLQNEDEEQHLVELLARLGTPSTALEEQGDDPNKIPRSLLMTSTLVQEGEVDLEVVRVEDVVEDVVAVVEEAAPGEGDAQVPEVQPVEGPNGSGNLDGSLHGVKHRPAIFLTHIVYIECLNCFGIHHRVHELVKSHLWIYVHLQKHTGNYCSKL